MHGLQLGDMTIGGKWPLRIISALAVISAEVHAGYDAQSDTVKGGSKDTCLFTSLAVRDFLVEIGFRDATVRTCLCILRAVHTDDCTELWSVGIGVPGQHPIPHKFNGHAVCTVPSLGLLIDTTLYPAIRPYWSDVMRGMMAIPFHEPRKTMIFDRHPFAVAELEITPDRILSMIWCDRPEINWRSTIDSVRNARRRAMTKHLVAAFEKVT